MQKGIERLRWRIALATGRRRRSVFVRRHVGRAPRRDAGAATAALRDAERKSQLECEVGSEEVRKSSTIGANDRGVHGVFAGAEVIEQQVALWIAKQRVEARPCRPRRDGRSEE